MVLGQSHYAMGVSGGSPSEMDRAGPTDCCGGSYASTSSETQNQIKRSVRLNGLVWLGKKYAACGMDALYVCMYMELGFSVL